MATQPAVLLSFLPRGKRYCPSNPWECVPMTIRDLRVGSANLPTSAAHCIVGGSVAGLLLASRLARHHRQVVLLESGGLELDDETQGRMIPISAHDQQRREH